MVYTRQFKFSPFSIFSAGLFIPHTNEDPCTKDMSIFLRMVYHEMGNGVTYTGVRGHAHWCIFTDLELQLICELQSKVLIDMIKPLQNKAGQWP